jgi:hypothetical protein
VVFGKTRKLGQGGTDSLPPDGKTTEEKDASFVLRDLRELRGKERIEPTSSQATKREVVDLSRHVRGGLDAQLCSRLGMRGFDVTQADGARHRV